MRRPLIAGNWKMNLGHRDAIRLAEGLMAGVDVPPDRDCAVFPPFTSLAAVAEKLRDTPIAVGAQNLWHEPDGAYTGEISGNLIRQAGGTMVILGHSERRHVIGEGDELINKKVKAALGERLRPILCVGETLAEREGGRTAEVVSRQLREGLKGVAAETMRDVVIAYEPVWAIGTGKTATPEMAQDVHARLRSDLKALYSAAVANDTLILYGGSVKPGNIDGLMAMTDVDGALVGGASLDEADFHRIIWFEAAPSRKN
jgi:triosephosphate isomerase (TIM)